MRSTSCFVAILIALLPGCDSGGKVGGPPPAGKPAAEVDAKAVWWEYGENAAAADAKYKGKTLAITANVRKIEPAGAGYVADLGATVSVAPQSRAAYIRLDAKQKKWFNEGPPANVLAFLATGAEKGFASLKVPMPPQDTITLIGVCRGMEKNVDVFKGYTVSFERCVVRPEAKD